MEITLWECFKVSHEITFAFSLIALPLLALGVGKFRKRGTIITSKFFGGVISLLLLSGGILVLFQPVFYPDAPVLSSLPLRLALSSPLLLSWPFFYWGVRRGRLLLFYHFPAEKFFSWINEHIQKNNLPLKESTEEYMETAGWMRPVNFDPKLGKVWRYEPGGPMLITTFQVGPGGGTIMGSLGIQGKGDRKKLDPFLKTIETEIGKIEVQPSPGVGLAFLIPGLLILYAIIYGIYVVCFTPPPV